MSMYRPKAFASDDRATLLAFISAHSFASLVTLSGDQLLSSHVPVLAVSEGDSLFLRGHLARANGQWKATDANKSALAIFRASSHYISPNWYEAKRQHGRVVPTWDYEIVEARGAISFFEGRDRLSELVADLTEKHERSVGGHWQITDAPPDYINGMIAAIVGFEIRVTELAGAFKLSQNRSEADRKGVVAGLDLLDDSAARQMADRIRATDT